MGNDACSLVFCLAEVLFLIEQLFPAGLPGVPLHAFVSNVAELVSRKKESRRVKILQLIKQGLMINE